MKFAVLFPALLAAAVSTGCFADTEPQPSHSDEGRYQELVAGDQRAEWQVAPFRQVGLLLDTTATQVEARVDGGDWRPVEITWSEGDHKVGRLVLARAGSELELRANAPWTFGTVQFFDEVEASDTLTRDLPMAEPAANVAALGPSSFVISRAQWGARNPNRVCGDWHNPYRIAIHHTFLPADDGGDPASRMRQIQAYHIDTRGWCDIGYHFIVSQSGKIFQGRNEERTGAHVDDQNTGNIGISLIGDFERQTVSATQFAAAAKILGWAARTYDVPFNRSSIRGHREHSGQSTECPGANLLPRLQELINLAQQGGGSATGGSTTGGGTTGGGSTGGSTGGGSTRLTRADAVLLEVNWRSDEADAYTAGSSRGTPDAFPGDWIRGEIKFTNMTSVPLRGVKLGFESEHLVPMSYVIESDAPSFNGTTFRRNDADTNPNNPPHTQPGLAGTFGIYAMAPGETKRVTFDLNAGDYSIGAVEHGGLRAWVKHIDHYYDQADYDLAPSFTIFESPLQAAADIDVLSRNEWQFDGGESAHLEGWRGRAGAQPTVDVASGTLTVRTTAGQAVESPSWTKINADDWDQLVLRMGVEGSHTAAVYWARRGESFSATRAVTFDVSGRQSAYVLDLGAHPSWRGEIVRLRVVLSVDATTTAAIDAVFMQSSDGYVASARERRVQGAEVRLYGNAPAPLDPSVDGRGDSLFVEPAAESDAQSAGCSTTGSGSGTAGLWLIGAVLGLARRRR